MLMQESDVEAVRLQGRSREQPGWGEIAANNALYTHAIPVTSQTHGHIQAGQVTNYYYSHIVNLFHSEWAI